MRFSGIRAAAGGRVVTTDGVVGECCTLLVARRKPHLVARFLDYKEQDAGIEVLHLGGVLLERTKAYLRRHLDHTYSFTDCASFVAMEDCDIRESATTDGHFVEAGFVALLR